MRRRLVTLGAVILLAGCSTKGMIRADAIAPLLEDNILPRHDAYVQTGVNPDGSVMDPVEQATYLRSSELLRRVLDAAKGE